MMVKKTTGVLLLEVKVREFMQAEGMASIKGRGAVAVSGGPDSTALVRLLHRIQPSGREGLQLMHVNFGLRGLASDGDEKFVRILARELGLSVSVHKVRARPSGNIQDWARKLRYQWFSRVQNSKRLAWVATGHTADDQAETLLERLGRGAGPMGLSAIRPSVRIHGALCIRPFLLVPRQEVLGYLRGLRQKFRKDASNKSDKYTRNRIRKILEKVDPKGRHGLSRRLAQSALLTGEMMKLVEDTLKPSMGPRGRGLAVRELIRGPKPLSRWALRLMAVRSGVSESSLAFEKIESGLALASGPRKARSRLTLGRGFSFARQDGFIRVVSNPRSKKKK